MSERIAVRTGDSTPLRYQLASGRRIGTLRPVVGDRAVLGDRIQYAVYEGVGLLAAVLTCQGNRLVNRYGSRYLIEMEDLRKAQTQQDSVQSRDPVGAPVRCRSVDEGVDLGAVRANGDCQPGGELNIARRQTVTCVQPVDRLLGRARIRTLPIQGLERQLPGTATGVR